MFDSVLNTSLHATLLLQQKPLKLCETRNWTQDFFGGNLSWRRMNMRINLSMSYFVMLPCRWKSPTNSFTLTCQSLCQKGFINSISTTTENIRVVKTFIITWPHKKILYGAIWNSLNFTSVTIRSFLLLYCPVWKNRIMKNSRTDRWVCLHRSHVVKQLSLPFCCKGWVAKGGCHFVAKGGYAKGGLQRVFAILLQRVGRELENMKE